MPAGRSVTKNGKGGSTTTGLQGSSREPAPGITVIEAVETITAFRDGRSLGAARAVRQVRTTNAEKTVVEQPDYCWGRRSLPNAELVEVGEGLTGSGVFEGKATFFGKGDTEDEGTGGPVFGTVQTDSSVFGISLKKARMQATIVMPADSPVTKRERTKGYGAEVVLYDRDKEDREAIANGIAQKRGATLVRPYDDPFVIAGQGTAGREIAEDMAAFLK